MSLRDRTSREVLGDERPGVRQRPGQVEVAIIDVADGGLADARHPGQRLHEMTAAAAGADEADVDGVGGAGRTTAGAAKAADLWRKDRRDSAGGEDMVRASRRRERSDVRYCIESGPAAHPK